MPKAASDKTTKAATSKANGKTGEKEKRGPSAYNLFVAKHMSEWKAANPGAKNKDAMKAIGAMWADSEENPNRGKPTKKKSKARKATASSSPTSSHPASDAKENDDPSSDGVDVA